MAKSLSSSSSSRASQSCMKSPSCASCCSDFLSDSPRLVKQVNSFYLLFRMTDSAEATFGRLIHRIGCETQTRHRFAVLTLLSTLLSCTYKPELQDPAEVAGAQVSEHNALNQASCLATCSRSGDKHQEGIHQWPAVSGHYAQQPEMLYEVLAPRPWKKTQRLSTSLLQGTSLFEENRTSSMPWAADRSLCSPTPRSAAKHLKLKQAFKKRHPTTTRPRAPRMTSCNSETSQEGCMV